ncbi:right-handed parallel beta-helix repeat-containing protein [Microbulbifer sp. PAAF003]|uniref:right-handed parallel beta-helix repeat-containing protein n=1 Tax=unclassified Microbulbifer TaxID=2619833 RepID=UPI00403A1438
MKNRNMNSIKASLLAVSGIAALSLSAVASAVSCGDTITTAESLTGDILGCASHPALVIDAGGSLDMAGYHLSCDGSGIGIQLKDSDRVLEDTVGGSTITNCNNGVSAEGDGSHQIFDITASSNSIAGIALWSSGNTVEASDASGNGGMGIRVMGDGNRVRYSVASSNGLQGIKIVGDNTLIRFNETILNMSSGIVIDSGDGGIVANNLSDNNGVNGIMMLGLGQVGYLIIGNTAENNAGADLADHNHPACTGNVWIRNTFGSANDACIN